MHVIPFQLTHIKKKPSSHHQRSSSPLSIPYKVPVDLPFHHPYEPPYFFQNSSLGVPDYPNNATQGCFLHPRARPSRRGRTMAAGRSSHGEEAGSV
ncbi:hypothetical protein CEXT_744701 [Caerostris extrusa]|uniref:Uncharacterized protein n=1 Tax=Caerostris extrusa TaxID=172846 RepID=A0AAV4WGM2_CAEEX|nr:hypothetical protein CEXT_744701 [Caerostris extrusa]